jgi:hypothetical protein
MGLNPTFSLNISPNFAMASWTVEATRHFSFGLENCHLRDTVTLLHNEMEQLNKQKNYKIFKGYV